MQTTTSILPKRKNMSNSKKMLLSIFLILIISLMILKPNLCINSVYSGLAVWAKCVLPSLLPFMFFTKLLTNLNFISKLTSKFYRLSSKLFLAPKISSYVFLMSIISGYPVGAKIISEFYSMGIITQRQANKLATFCSTSGPLFIIGSVGASMFKDAKIGYIIFFAHIVTSIINGIIFRKTFVDKTEIIFENIQKNDENDAKNTQKTQNLLQNSMKDSILSVLIVGGFIAIAFLIIDLFNNLNIFYPINFLLELCGLKNGTANAISSGFFEVSKGCVMLSGLSISKTLCATIASFLIGFGGLSVFLQATVFLSSAKVNLKFYFFQKFVHGILNAGLTFLICFAIGI